MDSIKERPNVEARVTLLAQQEAQEFLKFTREALNPYGSNTLIQVPVSFFTKGHNEAVGDHRGLFDCGANKSFISPAMVELYHFKKISDTRVSVLWRAATRMGTTLRPTA